MPLRRSTGDASQSTTQVLPLPVRVMVKLRTQSGEADHARTHGMY